TVSFGPGCTVPVPFSRSFEARPSAVFSASAGGAATSGGAGMSTTFGVMPASAPAAAVVVFFDPQAGTRAPRRVKTRRQAVLRMGVDPSASPRLLQGGFLPGPDTRHESGHDQALQPARRQRRERHHHVEPEAGHDEGAAALEGGERPARAAA